VDHDHRVSLAFMKPSWPGDWVVNGGGAPGQEGLWVTGSRVESVRGGANAV
jgi:hypothetical protein